MKLAHQQSRVQSPAPWLLLLLVWLPAMVGPAAAAPPLYDANITIAVETALFGDDYVPADAIDVTTADGIVTLAGTVDNLLAKERAVRIAESIKGVQAVIDRIGVAPETRTDTEIKADVTQALLDDPAVSRYDIGIVVTNGTVTLTGRVNSYAELQLAPAVVQGVRGVRAVINNIQFSYADLGPRSDTAITSDVRDRLARDIWVYDKVISVVVFHGVVQLIGFVPSVIEKHRATDDAWVAGVHDVDATQLKVVPWLESSSQRKHRHAARTDAALARDVTAAFSFDPRVNVTNVEVTVQDSIVTLRGIVNNLAAKHAAEADTRDTVGVWEIHNLLKVRPATVPTDAELTKRIAAALHRDPYLEVSPVNVWVRHGIVTLSGMVDTIAARTQAAVVASRIQGVVAVRNCIVAMPATQDELLNPPEISYQLPPSFVVFPSANRNQQLLKAVQYQLSWNPFVDANQVQVDVSGGIVTLTGTVGSWLESSAAENSAIQAGAIKVLNQLKVRHP